MDDCLGRMDAIGERKYEDDAKRRKDDDHSKKRRKADAGDKSAAFSSDDDDNDEGFAEQPTSGETTARQTVADARADAVERERKLEHDLADAQSRADEACMAWGLKAKAPR